MRSESTHALASVLAPDDSLEHGAPPSEEVLCGCIEDVVRRRGLGRPSAALGDEGDPRFFAWWLLRMAQTTYARALRPLQRAPADVLARFEARLVRRPAPDERYAQLHVDAESSVRRALAVRESLADAPGRVLAVGDDDAVSLALGAMGVRDTHVVDIDRTLLGFLREAGETLDSPVATHAVDIFQQPVPAALRRRCAVAVTDPIRNGEDALQFVAFAAAALRRDAPSRLFLVDHPDWNLEHDTLMSACRSMGFELSRVFENLHAYPLSPERFALRHEAAACLGWTQSRLDRLIAHTSAWSHLYVLTRG